MIFLLLYFLTLNLNANEVNPDICGLNNDANINYHVDYGNPIYRSVSKFPEDVKNVDKNHLKGLTDINYKKSYNIKVKLLKKNNIACLKIDNIDIYFGYPNINVLIYDKYTNDSCEYKVVKKHENEHIKIYQGALKFYSQNIGRIILNRVKNKKQMLVYNVDDVQKKIEEYIKEVKDFITSDKELNTIELNMMKEIEYRNSLLDSKESYNKTKRLCNNW